MRNAKVYHGGGSGKGKGFSSNGSSDSYTVKVSTNDTTANFLSSKIQTSNDLFIGVINSGADEKLVIGRTPDTDKFKVKNSLSDQTADYLKNKIVSANTNLVITTDGAGTYEQLMFTVAPQSGDHLVRAIIEDTNAKSLYDKISAGTGIAKAAVQPSGDYLVEISAPDIGKLLNTTQDTTKGFLSSKVQAGSNIVLSTINSGSNEKLQIAASTQNGDGKILVTNADTTRDYLLSKLVAGTNITLTKQNAGANENIKISATGSDAGYSLNWGTGLGLSVGAFITPCTEGSSWANGNIGQLIRKAGTLNRICVMLPRFVSYNASDSITFQVRRIAASSALGSTALTASSGTALGTIAVTCPVTSGAFWYNNYNSSDVSWSLNANDIVFIVVSGMTVNAVTGVSIYTLINE